MKKEAFKSFDIQATEEKIFSAEKNITWVRALVVILNSIIYIFMMSEHESIPWLANSVIIIALLYSFYVIVFKPYKTYPIFLTSYSTYGTDAILITLWLLATGGFDSPFYLLWYISIIAVSFRFAAKTIWFTAFLYSFCYIALIILLNDVAGNYMELTVRVGYIFCTAFIGIMMSGVTLDQIEQKKQMQQLAFEAEQAEKDLKKQTLLYENLLKAQSEMGEGVAIIENDKFVYVNDAFIKIFGYNKDEILNLSSSLQLIVPEKRKSLSNKKFSQNNNDFNVISGQTVAVKKDGSNIYITYSLKLMKINAKVQLFSIVRDITEEVLAKEALIQKTIDLSRSKEMDKQKDEFIGIASHELKTPLTSIHGYAQLLEQVFEDQLYDPDAAKTYIKKTQLQIRRLTSLINDLLDISRIQGGKLSFDMGEIVVNDLIQEVLDSMQQPGVEIIKENITDKSVIGDSGRIEQVLVNFISNAIKYSPNSSKVIIGTKDKDQEVIFYVKDFGLGIPQEDFDKIFTMFYRVPSTEKRASGLGIGLYISGEIIENHKGKIWVESEVGKGSCFYFTLPIYK